MKKSVLLNYLIIASVFYGVLVVFYYYKTREYAIHEAQLRIEEILRTYKAVRVYNSKQQKQEVYQLQKQGAIDKNYFDPSLLSSTYCARNVNSYYNNLREKDEKFPIIIKFASKNPRNPINKASPHEAKILDTFNNNFNMKNYKEIIDTPNGKILYYAVPTKRTTQKCMKCHSDPKLAPKDLIKKYGAKNGFFEKTGQIRALLWTIMPLNDVYKDADRLFLYLWNCKEITYRYSGNIV